jgi:hypothetical protein
MPIGNYLAANPLIKLSQTVLLFLEHLFPSSKKAHLISLGPCQVCRQLSKKTEPFRPPRRCQATQAERPAAAGLAAAAAAWFLAPVPPRRPSSRWQGAGVHPLVNWVLSRRVLLGLGFARRRCSAVELGFAGGV